jgi:hypothetical protein
VAASLTCACLVSTAAAHALGPRDAAQVHRRPFHVLLTSYELLMGQHDRPRLSRIAWQGLVVDEGHRCVCVAAASLQATLGGSAMHFCAWGPRYSRADALGAALRRA